MSATISESKYAGVPLPEVNVTVQRLLSAETTEKVLNAILTVKDIRQINMKGESLPAKIDSGPHRGIANNHSERKMIKYGDGEIELKHLVGDFYVELAVENEKQLEERVRQIDDAVKPILKDIGYGVNVGRYSKYRPTVHDYE
ncbi:MAG: methyl-coenzyme M reductase operon protein D [archaeon]|nr:methyl-coenzyme M reductase operon protein D [archaeon]